jgi:hypothetical protein
MQMSNLDKLRQLSRREQGLLFQSALLLPVVHAGLLSLGFHRLRRVMEWLSPLQRMDTPASDTEILERAREMARIVSIAAEHGVYKASCLRRSLLVWWLLRRAGIPGQVCFGVRTVLGKLEAHAWVEYHGIVVNDSGSVHENFQALREGFPSTQFGL